MEAAIGFDQDGTLLWGNPPGPITREHLQKAKSLGYIIGGSAGKSSEEQRKQWQENGIEPDFVISKGELPTLSNRFDELIHVGDAEDDKEWAKRAGARYMTPEEFISWIEAKT